MINRFQLDIPDTNIQIYDGFNRFLDETSIHRTHLFNGRYENIYLDESHIPELKTVIEFANQFASNILGVTGLSTGYWFNHMPPGSTTTLHSHDDDDELLSAVYYVYVPENAGNLIIHSVDNSETEEITPENGEFIFFKPDVKHEVSRNNSDDYRLSIGLNFGKKT